MGELVNEPGLGDSMLEVAQGERESRLASPNFAQYEKENRLGEPGPGGSVL